MTLDPSLTWPLVRSHAGLKYLQWSSVRVEGVEVCVREREREMVERVKEEVRVSL